MTPELRFLLCACSVGDAPATPDAPADIERLVRLYSNPGEIVFSPFCGIGSELYTALKLGRRTVIRASEIDREERAQERAGHDDAHRQRRHHREEHRVVDQFDT